MNPRVKIAKINKYEKRCVGEQSGEECKNEGTEICHRCSMYAGIPNNRVEKVNMFR